VRFCRIASRTFVWLLLVAVMAGCAGGKREDTGAASSATSVSGSAGSAAENRAAIGSCDSGNVNDPDDPCVITTVEQLQRLDDGPEGHYALGSAIDASATEGWNDGAGFQPIRAFAGTFDGRGNAISGLYINRPGDNNVGLFANTLEGSQVRDVRLASARVSGGSYVGMLVGEAQGAIVRSHVEGRVDGGGHVGGLAGVVLPNGSVTGASARGQIVGTEALVGGLVGRSRGQIDSSYSLASVTGRSDVGGLVGSSGGNVNRSYSLQDSADGEPMLISTRELRVGGLIGQLTEGGAVQESYAVSFSGSTPLTDFVGHPLVSAVWSIAEGKEYPDLVSNPRSTD